jgi:hypothetical protein
MTADRDATPTCKPARPDLGDAKPRDSEPLLGRERPAGRGGVMLAEPEPGLAWEPATAGETAAATPEADERRAMGDEPSMPSSSELAPLPLE